MGWNVTVNTPLTTGKPYVAQINTNGSKVEVLTVKYPSSTTCEINCTVNEHGRSSFNVTLGYIYDPNAEPKVVTVSALLDGGVEGADSPTVQED